MKKLSSFINESNKQDFSTKLSLTLENGVVLEATINVRDVNESFATEQILKSISSQKIKSVKILEYFYFGDENNDSENFGELDNTTTPKTVELFVPLTTFFETNPYRIDIIADAVKDDEDVLSTHSESQYGWNNDQPDVIIITVETDNLTATKDRLVNKIKNALHTNHVRLEKKDW